MRRWLQAGRALGLAEGRWCLGAGAVRALVWDAWHGHAHPAPLADLDLAWFGDPSPSGERDQALVARLQATCPEVRWDVQDQAAVHHWATGLDGLPPAPLSRLEQALATWPETATAVGLALDPDDQVRVFAPSGLADLFTGRLRHNPAQASTAVFLARVKRWPLAQRWPRVQILLPAAPGAPAEYRPARGPGIEPARPRWIEAASAHPPFPTDAPPGAD